MRYIAVSIFILALGAGAAAQEHNSAVSGTVTSEQGDKTEPIVGANVFWAGTSTGAVTGVKGEFSLPRVDGATKLVVSHAGYIGDTLEITSGTRPLRIVLVEGKSIGEVTVTGERKGVSVAPIEFRTETVSEAELAKAPCCDLSGCFSTSISVEPSVTDVIADTRELRMLGMAGVYTHLLFDNTPTLFSGINAQYGLSFIPGTLIRKMYIVKGANSVLQGYEAVSGLVNVLTQEGPEADALFLNGFTSASLERQFNASTYRRFGNWSTVFAGHLTQPSNAMDGDGNGYIDMPRINRYSLFNKWNYDNSEGTQARIGAKYTNEHRVGGMRGFDVDRDAGNTTLYGQVMDNARAEAYGTANIPVWGEKTLLKMHAATAFHDQDAWFGATRYTARQRQWYSDASLVLPLGGEHTLAAGASYKYFTLDEDLRFNSNPLAKTYEGKYECEENVPGIFSEMKLVFGDLDEVTVLAGLRADAHNEFGTFATPRLFVKWEPSFGITLRAVAGTGARRPLVLSENAVLFASHRDLLFPERIELERARNYGVSLTRLFEFAGITFTTALDAYRTEVRRQLIPDYDADPFTVRFNQRETPVVSNTFVAEIMLDPADGLECKVAYSFTDSYEDRNDGRKTVPFTSRHRTLVAASYDHRALGLLFATTLEWFGAQHLPDTRLYPDQFRMPSTSPSYAMLNLQVTKRLNAFEFYAGIENILDERQANPILNPSNPFDRYFETSFIWGPVKGREFFAGFRFRIADHQEDAAHDDEN